MSAKFFALLTVIGANKLAKATALGTTLKITQMAVGDGGGTLPTPDTQQTKLVGEKRRAGLNSLFVDPKNDSQIIAEQVIPENEGGYWIREIGLFDDEGSLIAVGNCPETYKPQLQEGSGRTQTIRMILTVSHTESVELKVDPSVILATREFVNDAIESASKQTLAEVAKLYATKTELSTGLNKVQKSADDANTNANSRVPSTRKVNNKPLSTDITLTAGDVGAATPAQVNEAKTAASNAQATANSGVSKADAAQKTANDAVSKANTAQTAANNANTNANGRVPNTRKVNGKPLSADISLTAGDVGAATPAQVNEAKTAANNANNNANGRVPKTRRINNKELSADINISIIDIKPTKARKIWNWGGNDISGKLVTLSESIKGCLCEFALAEENKSTISFVSPRAVKTVINIRQGATGFVDIIIEPDGRGFTVLGAQWATLKEIWILE
ncbi:phage tail protein [Proteus mirabilis]|uniref:phage tail protein n=1 Tax=Proteus mirabilis TaxID=584 RepID=UPI001F5C7730|nr:phage tail protein [Proteus mirabilis]